MGVEVQRQTSLKARWPMVGQSLYKGDTYLR